MGGGDTPRRVVDLGGWRGQDCPVCRLRGELAALAHDELAVQLAEAYQVIAGQREPSRVILGTAQRDRVSRRRVRYRDACGATSGQFRLPSPALLFRRSYRGNLALPFGLGGRR